MENCEKLLTKKINEKKKKIETDVVILFKKNELGHVVIQCLLLLRIGCFF